MRVDVDSRSVAERATDRAYWTPLREELERLRRGRSEGEAS